MNETKLVVATQKGFYGNQLREEGHRFEVNVNETAAWFKDVEDAPDLAEQHQQFADNQQFLADLTAAASQHVQLQPDGVVTPENPNDAVDETKVSTSGLATESPFALFTRDQLMAELTARGIVFKATDKRDVLLSLLMGA